MKDQYVGDIGDFMKYGLLRAVCHPQEPDGYPTLKLGVIWYLFPDLEMNNDGQFLHHLEHSRKRDYHSCDPDLHQLLTQIISDEARCIASIRERKVLPDSTVFYETPLSFFEMPSGTPKAIEARLLHRTYWLQAAYEAVQSCDIVFVDPDNGLEVDSIKRHHNFGPKFVFYDELLPLMQQGKSLVIYQHKNRSGSVQDQIRTRVKHFKEKLGYGGDTFSLYFGTSGGRIFFILPTPAHSEIIGNRLNAFQQSLWAKHVQIY
jgi:hypothetical protein